MALLMTPVLAQAAEKESVYERVLRTGTIRCGYIVWPPYMTRDDASRTFSGMNYDYAEAVAKTLDLRIEWVAEINPGTQVETLKSGKADAICTAEGPIVPSTIKYLRYSAPMAYVPFYIYARTDDARFDGDNPSINNPDVKIAVIDGDVSGQLSSVHFPKAQRYPLPQLVSPAQMMLDVAGGKADIIINDPVSMKDFIAENPGRLHRIGGNEPLGVIPNTFSVLRDPSTDQFLDMLNQAIENVKYSGAEKAILSKYETSGSDLKAFYPTAQPFEVK